MTSSMERAIFAILVALGATASATPPIPGENEQTTHALGDEFVELRVSPTNAKLGGLPAVVTVERGHLRVGGLEFTGGAQNWLVLDSKRIDSYAAGSGLVSGRVVVTAGAPHLANVYGNFDWDSVGDRWEYIVMQETGFSSPSRKALCGTHSVPGTTVEVPNPAFVLPGIWTRKGVVDNYTYSFTPSALTEPPGQFTFACVPIVTRAGPPFLRTVAGGAAVKCIEWGYKPWPQPTTVTVAPPWSRTSPEPNEAAAAAVAAHSACVHMAMADYCGDGSSYTVDGTAIDGWGAGSIDQLVARRPLDTAQPSTWNGEPAGFLVSVSDPTPPFAFEAAWNARGAVCLTHRRWASVHALLKNRYCPVAAKRYQCESTVPPPFCEEWTEEQLEAKKAVVFNYSPYSDLPLYLCATNGGPPWVTTTHVDTYSLHSAADGKQYWNAYTTPGSAPLECAEKPIGYLFNSIVAGFHLIPRQFENKIRPFPEAPAVPLGYLITDPTAGVALNEYACANQQKVTTTQNAIPDSCVSPILLKALGSLLELQ